MNNDPVFTLSDVGCYADSARGIYTGALIIEMATTHGFKPYGEDLNDTFDNWMDASHKGYTWSSAWEEYLTEREDYHELWEEAENYLNTLCDDSVWFGSSECGDWGLWANEEEEEEYEV